MNNYKFLIVSASRESDIKSIYWHEIADKFSDIINGNAISIDTITFLNNTKGLSELYNEVLDKYRDSDYSYIIFLHNDLIFVNLKAFLLEIINENRPIMGLAGCIDAPRYGVSPLAWNTIAGEKQAGEVWHKINPDLPLIKNRYANNSRAFPAISIDGLCIIVSREAFINPKLKFDNRFTFDFYDMDFCFTAATLGIKIGIINAPVIHYSVGNGILNDRYKMLEKIFREKWNVPNEIQSYTYNSWASLMMTKS